MKSPEEMSRAELIAALYWHRDLALKLEPMPREGAPITGHQWRKVEKAEHGPVKLRPFTYLADGRVDL